MLVRRLSTLALLAALPVLLANCSSDATPATGGAGTPGAAGTGTGGTGSAGQPSAGAPAGGSIAVAGGGSTGLAGGGAGGAGGAAAGSGAGGASTGGTGTGGTGGGSSAGAAGKGNGGGSSGGATGGSFTLTSPDQAEAAKFDGKFTCNGGSLGAGVNPELNWAGAPSGTMSFVITFIDTTLAAKSDAMSQQMSQHWAIWNIPATIMKFPQGTKTLGGDLTAAKQSGAFLTPCAVSVMNGMDDEYEFTVYALSTATLNITGTSVANALNALKSASVLGKATLHGHAGVKGK